MYAAVMFFVGLWPMIEYKELAIISQLVLVVMYEHWNTQFCILELL